MWNFWRDTSPDIPCAIAGSLLQNSSDEELILQFLIGGYEMWRDIKFHHYLGTDSVPFFFVVAAFDRNYRTIFYQISYAQRCASSYIKTIHWEKATRVSQVPDNSIKVQETINTLL